jgi:hypothetical protein
MLNPEGVAAETGHRWRIDELCEDHGHSHHPATVDEAADIRDDLSAGGYLKRCAFIQERVLHVHDEQCCMGRFAPVQFVDSVLPGCLRWFYCRCHDPTVLQRPVEFETRITGRAVRAPKDILSAWSCSAQGAGKYGCSNHQPHCAVERSSLEIPRY